MWEHLASTLIGTNENQTFCLSGMNDETRDNYESTHPIGTIATHTPFLTNPSKYSA